MASSCGLQGAILRSTLFLLSINDIPEGVTCYFAMLMVLLSTLLLYSTFHSASDLWEQHGLAPELVWNLQDTLD